MLNVIALIGPDSGVWWLLAGIIGFGIVVTWCAVLERRAERLESVAVRPHLHLVPDTGERGDPGNPDATNGTDTGGIGHCPMWNPMSQGHARPFDWERDAPELAG